MNPVLTKIKRKLKDKDASEMLRGGSMAMIFKVAGMGLNFLFTWLIAKYSGAGAVGVFYIFYTLILVGSIVGKAGLDVASLKLISAFNSVKDGLNVRMVFRRSVILTILFSALCGGLIIVFSRFIATTIFHKEHLATPVAIAGICVVPSALIFLVSESLRGLKLIAAYSFLQRGAAFFFGSVILIILYLSSNSDPFHAYTIGLYLSAATAFIIWIRSVPGVNPQLIETSGKAEFSSLLKLAWPMLITSSLGFVRGWIDTILLGIMTNDSEVGIYNVAIRLSMLATLPLMAVNSISAPKFSEYHAKGDMSMVGKTARQSTRMIFFASLPVMIIFLLIPGYIMGIYGEDFRPGTTALILLTFGQFISAISGSVGILMNMTGDERVFRNITTISTIICVALNLFLIPVWGINGAAFANMASLILSNLLCVWYIHRKHNIFVAYIPFIRK